MPCAWVPCAWVPCAWVPALVLVLLMLLMLMLMLMLMLVMVGLGAVGAEVAGWVAATFWGVVPGLRCIRCWRRRGGRVFRRALTPPPLRAPQLAVAPGERGAVGTGLGSCGEGTATSCLLNTGRHRARGGGGER